MGSAGHTATAAGVKTLNSMLVKTTSSRSKDLVNQGLSDKNGTIALGRIRERFGKTPGVTERSSGLPARQLGTT